MKVKQCELNKEFYENTHYSENVRGFIKTWDTLTDTRGTLVEEQLKCKGNKRLNQYGEKIMEILDVLDTHCKHFTTIPQNTADLIGLPLFIQLYPEHNIYELEIDIEKILPPYVQYFLIHEPDNSYPSEFLPPTNKQYLFKRINEYFDQNIYNLDDDLFTEDKTAVLPEAKEERLHLASPQDMED